MVGTTTTDVESNWDIADHDYTRGYHSKEGLNERLTPAEEDLIFQLTNALDEVPSPSVKKVSPGVASLELECQTEDVGTPDILKDFLDFDSLANVTIATNDNEKCQGTQQSPYSAPSPISKEQILEFLQDKVNSCSSESLLDSESGYGSISSPQSLRSQDEVLSPQSLPSSDEFEGHSMDLDIDSFTELFPSLF